MNFPSNCLPSGVFFKAINAYIKIALGESLRLKSLMDLLLVFGFLWTASGTCPCLSLSMASSSWTTMSKIAKTRGWKSEKYWTRIFDALKFRFEFLITSPEKKREPWHRLCCDVLYGFAIHISGFPITETTKECASYYLKTPKCKIGLSDHVVMNIHTYESFDFVWSIHSWHCWTTTTSWACFVRLTMKN